MDDSGPAARRMAARRGPRDRETARRSDRGIVARDPGRDRAGGRRRGVGSARAHLGAARAAARSRSRARSTAGARARAVRSCVISCVGVPEALRGRELFGCAESTYPSLPQAYDGGLARAAGGTLLVDHADQLGSDLWQALAKALADGRFEREGDAGAIPLRARVIALSRSPLAERGAARPPPPRDRDPAARRAHARTSCRSRAHFLGDRRRRGGRRGGGLHGRGARGAARRVVARQRARARRAGRPGAAAHRQRRDLGRGAVDRRAARADPLVQGRQARIRAPLCDRACCAAATATSAARRGWRRRTARTSTT